MFLKINGLLYSLYLWLMEPALLPPLHPTQPRTELLEVVKGMNCHVTVMDMISSIRDLHQVDIEIAQGLGLLADGIDAVKPHHRVVVTVLCMVNMVMIATVGMVTTAVEVLEAVDAETRIVNEVQLDFAGAQVHVVKINHCLHQDLNISSMTIPLDKGRSKVASPLSGSRVAGQPKANHPNSAQQNPVCGRCNVRLHVQLCC